MPSFSSAPLKMQHAGDLSRPTKRWVRRLARVGHTAIGVVYGIFGILAVQAAFGSQAAPDGTDAALHAIAGQPFGRVLLGITAAGLVGYVLWRFVQAINDPDNKGDDAKGYAIRAGFAVSGLVYAALAVTAASVALGGGSGSGGESSSQEWTAWLMAFPFGRWMVAAVGVTVGIVGVVHFYKVYTADFMREYNLAELAPEQRTPVLWIGRFGLAARGVVFVIIAWFLARAAWQANAGLVRGLGGALSKVAAQPYGRFLMAVVAVGLISYGLYCITQARYRYFKVT